MPLTATAFLRFAGLAETPTANAKAAMKLIRGSSLTRKNPSSGYGPRV